MISHVVLHRIFRLDGMYESVDIAADGGAVCTFHRLSVIARPDEPKLQEMNRYDKVAAVSAVFSFRAGACGGPQA